MQYLLLIYGNEEYFGKLTEAERTGSTARVRRLHQKHRTKRTPAGGNELQPVAQRDNGAGAGQETSRHRRPVRRNQGATGRLFYLIEAKDLDEAIAVAARIPSVRWGAIEVRPIDSALMLNMARSGYLVCG